MKKVIFRIREEYDEKLKITKFIPEAKNYLLDKQFKNKFCNISCNSASIHINRYCTTYSDAQSAIDNTKRLIDNYGRSTRYY